MKTEIKELYSKEKVSKKGTKYRKVLVLITIEGNEFLEIFYIYEK